MDPIIAQKGPFTVDLESGKNYYWCACGKSSNQPFCDGSHRDTGISPKQFSVITSGKAHLCGCKHSKNPPYCDGSHAKL
jgi:CDGSH iron-sulfur domain-containing protein 3